MKRLSRKEQLKDVLAARSGEEDAYSRLFKAAEPVLRRYLYRLVDEADLDDIVQNTMTKAFTRLHQFSGDAAFITWVISIGRNEALGHFRKNAAYRKLVPVASDGTVTLDDGTNVPLMLPGYEDRTVERRNAHETIHRAVDRLSAEQRLAMRMKLDGYNDKEIAERLDKSTAATKSILHRAKISITERILALAA